MDEFDPELPCDTIAWHEFVINYFHAYIIAIVTLCITGVFTNVLNIVVLTRKEMMSSTSIILTSLAVVDILLMLAELPVIFSFNDLPAKDPCLLLAYRHNVVFLFLSYIHGVHNGIFNGLTLILAVCSLVEVTFPLKYSTSYSPRRIIAAIVFCYIISPLLFVPFAIIYTVVQIPELSDVCPGGAFLIKLTQLAEENAGLWRNINLWGVGMITRIVPSLAIIIVFFCLLWALYNSNRRSIQAMDSGPRQLGGTSCMLLVILLLFLLTRLPLTILLLLITPPGGSGAANMGYCGIYLLGFFELLARLSSTNSFFVYCSTSGQFRNTVKLVFNRLMRLLSAICKSEGNRNMYATLPTGSSVVTIGTELDDVPFVRHVEQLRRFNAEM